jgi:hypothetical protein
MSFAESDEKKKKDNLAIMKRHIEFLEGCIELLSTEKS